VGNSGISGAGPQPARRRLLRGGASLTGLATLAVAVTQAALAVPAFAAAHAPLAVGTVAHAPKGAAAAAAPSDATKVTVDVAVTPRNESALNAYAAAVNDPKSSQYRQFLSTAQFNASFAPSQATIDAIDGALRNAGLTPGAAAGNHLLIPVTATVGQLRSAFGVKFAGYKLSGGRYAFGATSAPKIDAAVAASVKGVIGLDDFSSRGNDLAKSGKSARTATAAARRTAKAVAQASAPTAPCTNMQSFLDSVGTDGTDYYAPLSLAKAYGLDGQFSAGHFGTGVSVAVVEWEAVSEQSVADYESCFGLSSPISYRTVDGGPTQTADSGNNIGIESALDIETVSSLAPGASILDYEGPDLATVSDAGWLDTLNAPVSDNTASVISISYGGCQSEMTSTFADEENVIFAAAAAQGQSVFVSTGDNGSTGCNLPADAAVVSAADPAAQTFVTAVGGTTMQGIATTTLSTWNESGVQAGAGGGGVSAFEPQNSGAGFYQAGFTGAGYTATTCGATGSLVCRQIPDVSAAGDPLDGYPIVYGDGPAAGTPTNEFVGVWGGTSWAAPVWGAIVAVIDSAGVCSSGRAGMINTSLYQRAAKSSTYSAILADVTAGNNDYTPSGYTGGKYAAGTGYDMATGLGSPKVAGLATGLCSPAKHVTRLWGSNAIGTSVSISQYDFATLQAPMANGKDAQGRVQAGAVVLSRSDKFFDALAGSALAAQKSAPLLITPPTALNTTVQAEIQRILPSGGTVYLLGGTAALSTTVQAKLTSLGYATVRFAGSNMFDTAVKIDQAISATPTKVIVATGAQYYDALAAGAAAGANPGTVVVLTNGTTMPAVSATYLNSLTPTAAYGAGGPGYTALQAAITAGTIHWTITPAKLVGARAPDTALLLANAFFTHPKVVAVATTTSWFDALTGGSAVGFNGGPLLLTAPTAFNAADASYISTESPNGLNTALILGGPAALPASIATSALTALG